MHKDWCILCDLRRSFESTDLRLPLVRGNPFAEVCIHEDADDCGKDDEDNDEPGVVGCHWMNGDYGLGMKVSVFLSLTRDCPKYSMITEENITCTR
jgi:hypothetical protein